LKAASGDVEGLKLIKTDFIFYERKYMIRFAISIVHRPVADVSLTKSLPVFFLPRVFVFRRT
jgi:hypothetical protein